MSLPVSYRVGLRCPKSRPPGLSPVLYAAWRLAPNALVFRLNNPSTDDVKTMSDWLKASRRLLVLVGQRELSYAVFWEEVKP